MSVLNALNSTAFIVQCWLAHRAPVWTLLPQMQRARDELATALLMAERRTQEAEEEQLKAEAAAAALAQQLAEAQREAAHVAATTATAAGGSVAADQASVAGTPVAEPSQPAAQRGAAQREQQPQRAELQSEGSEAQLARDAEVLLAELDRERHRSEELVRMLEAAEHEAVLATDRLMKAQQVGPPPAGGASLGGAAGACADHRSAQHARPRESMR